MATLEEIRLELATHPKEQQGISRADIDSIPLNEKTAVAELFLARLEKGDVNYRQQLEWLLGEHYIPTLKFRLASLPSDAKGKVYLPFYLYKATGDQNHLEQMIFAIVEGKGDYDSRENAFTADWYLRGLIGKEPVYWDLCRYLILNDESLEMRKDAMLWLAYEKGVPGVAIAYKLPAELTECVEHLYATHSQDPQALAVLNQLHQDTGHLRIDENRP